MRRRNNSLPIRECWVLHPGETWHGFSDLEDDYCMLDPDQGVDRDARRRRQGWARQERHSGEPPDGVSALRGVEVEKTTDFTILFLFSIGITKGKWGTLLNALLEFKRDYDRNARSRRRCRDS